MRIGTAVSGIGEMAGMRPSERDHEAEKPYEEKTGKNKRRFQQDGGKEPERMVCIKNRLPHTGNSRKPWQILPKSSVYILPREAHERKEPGGFRAFL